VPFPMALVLVVLAIGSVLAGYIGLPKALGGSSLQRFLEPSFAAADTATTVAIVPGAPRAAPGDMGAGRDLTDNSQLRATRAEDGPARELGLMGVSTAVALGGVGLAVFFFLKNPRAASRVAERFAGVRTVLLNKYYVDEIYDRAIVQPMRLVADRGLWKGVDGRLIDGAVDGLGETLPRLGELVRRVQTGSVRAYAASLFLGVVLVLSYFWWR
jgi:NADH-quinone oxidoreductase subunit L